MQFEALPAAFTVLSKTEKPCDTFFTISKTPPYWALLSRRIEDWRWLSIQVRATRVTRLIGVQFLAALLCAVVLLYLGILERNSALLSSTEAEYVAFSDIVNEALFVKEDNESLGIEKSPIVEFEDNEEPPASPITPLAQLAHFLF